MKKLVVVVLATLSCFVLSAQEIQKAMPDDTDLQEIIENTAIEGETETFDYDAFIEDLENLQLKPLNINRATRDELNDLRFLTPTQITALLNHINKYGKLISIYEMQAIPGFDPDFITRILPYIKVPKKLDDVSTPWKEMLYKGRYNFVARYQQVIERSRGYEPPSKEGAQHYLGPPFKLFTRFRYTYGLKVSYGFTAEKDAGEEFFRGSNRAGFDFYSGHIFIRDIKFIKALAIGDYEVRLGQGLIQWNGFGFAKSPAVMNVKREGIKLRPYTSVNEINFMRGGAATVGFGHFELTAFGSYKGVDATLITQQLEGDTSIAEEEFFTAFNQTGFHRTPNEIRNKNSVNQLTAGGNISYNRRKWHIGGNVVYNRFSRDFRRNLRPYNQFDFSRQQLINASVDYHAVLRNFHFFGEAAVSDNGGFGLMNGALISLDSKVDMSVVHRYYSRDFQSLTAVAFAESTRPQNEHGLYMGMIVRPHRMLQFDAFVDVFRHQWLRYLTDAPSYGAEAYLQAMVKPNRRTQAYVRYRFKVRKRNEPDNETPINFLDDNSRQSLRFDFNYKTTDWLTLRNRVEVSFFKNGSRPLETGYMIYQDVNFKKMGFPLSFDTRLAIFRTASFNTRIYAYESDVLYTFSIPAYFGYGMRYYLMMRYAVTRNIDLWVRWAQTQLFDRETFGSGLDEIPRNRRSEIKVQMRLRF